MNGMMVRMRNATKEAPPLPPPRDPPHYLREWRQFRRFTQESLGARIEVGHSTLSRIERGEIKLTEDMILRLAAALRIKPGDLFRNPQDRRHVWALAEKIAQLPAKKVDTATAIVDALASETEC
jgi:transcriptional regulator with XRE-family HTH domain